MSLAEYHKCIHRSPNLFTFAPLLYLKRGEFGFSSMRRIIATIILLKYFIIIIKVNVIFGLCAIVIHAQTSAAIAPIFIATKFLIFITITRLTIVVVIVVSRART